MAALASVSTWPAAQDGPGPAQHPLVRWEPDFSGWMVRFNAGSEFQVDGTTAVAFLNTISPRPSRHRVARGGLDASPASPSSSAS